MIRLFFFPVAIVVYFAWFSPSVAEDWPHWRGKNRSGVSAENSGWEKGVWPMGQPLWQGNVGEGAAAPLAVGDHLYTIGWEDGNDVVRVLDVTSGKSLWEQRYPSPKHGRHAKGDQRMYRGVTASSDYDSESGLLYTLSCDGRLSAWDTQNKGSPVWHLNLYGRFDIPPRPQITARKNTLRDYGYTTAPFVTGKVVIVEAGSPKYGNLIAFDKLSGELRWQSENRDPAGHTGGITPIKVGGIPCVAVATSWNVLVVRIDGINAGKTVAEFEWKTDFSNTIAGIAVSGEELLVSSRYNQMAMVKVSINLKNGAREIWRNTYPTGVCTPVIHKGRIYFANKGIYCVDFKTGKLMWSAGKISDAGSCFVTGDDRLVIWGNGGDLMLVETAERSPEKFKLLFESRRVFNDMAWTHVIAADGRLYCKVLNGDLACFSLTTKTKARAPVEHPKKRRRKKAL